MPLSWLPFGQIRASATSRAEALESARIEALASPDGAATCIAGGKETKGALPVRTPSFDGAVYSSRGRGYARYNEDGAGLFADASGSLYAVVCDQAGGLGGRVRGAASQIGVQRIFESFRTVATTKELDDAGIAATIMVGIDRAHDDLIARQEGEVTTAITAVLRPGAAILVNSGDSGAMHFDGEGVLKAITTFHEHDAPEAVGCLTHAIGLTPELPAPDPYRWLLSQGDWLVLSSDGLLDAGIGDADLGQLLIASESAEAAVNRLCTRVLRAMTMMRAKPDNLTVLAIRVL
jgi:serine/threonine protein phosphatase PrpC